MTMKVLHNTCNMNIHDFPDMKALIPWACGHQALGIHIRQILHAHFKTIILCDQICQQVSYMYMHSFKPCFHRYSIDTTIA